MDFHPEIPLVALLGLVHLRIPIPLLVLGGTGGGDQGGINDRALFHGYTVGLEVGFHRLKISARPGCASPASAESQGSWSHPGSARRSGRSWQSEVEPTGRRAWRASLACCP